MPKQARSRGWVFTWNNYTPEDLTYLSILPCRYIIYGKEVGAQGTPHLQGYVQYSTLKSLAQVASDFKKNFVQIAKWEDNAIKYCQKQGDYTERGDRPLTRKQQGQLGKEYWDTQLKLIKEGKHDEIDAKLQIQQAKNIDYIYNKHLSQKKLTDTLEENVWYWGPTRSGKPRKVQRRNGLGTASVKIKSASAQSVCAGRERCILRQRTGDGDRSGRIEFHAVTSGSCDQQIVIIERTDTL